MHDVYSVCKPEKPSLVIFDSPHSGKDYPADFDYACDFNLLRQCEDEYVDDLFSGACDLGAGFLCAHFPRSYVDVNRAIDDIDPALLQACWQGDINPTVRSDAGIGLIRRLVTTDIPVYDHLLTQDAIQQRIDHYYTPYHDQLQSLLDQAYDYYGSVWHINCHSMPDETAKPRRSLGLIGKNRASADFVLGDRDATSCALFFTREVRDFIRRLGYRVTINDPFKGVELVARHGDPARGRHSLQIEVNKSLYMDETTSKKLKTYDKVKTDITRICEFICDLASRQSMPRAAD